MSIIPRRKISILRIEDRHHGQVLKLYPMDISIENVSFSYMEHVTWDSE
jgi:hypothetical protein